MDQMIISFDQYGKWNWKEQVRKSAFTCEDRISVTVGEKNHLDVRSVPQRMGTTLCGIIGKWVTLSSWSQPAQEPQRQFTVLEEDAFPAPRSYLHRSLPHCDWGVHSFPGLIPEPPAGFLPLLCGAGGGHAHPGALLGNEQQKRCKLQPPRVRRRVLTLSVWLPQLRQPCPLHNPREPLSRVPVCVSAQVGQVKMPVISVMCIAALYNSGCICMKIQFYPEWGKW